MNLTPIEKALEILARQEPAPARVKVISCPTSDHEDRTPSAKHYPDGHWYCYSCNARGSALDLYALRQGLTIRQALNNLGCFDDDYVPPPRKPQPRKVWMPKEVRDILLASTEYAERWEVAKLLALQEPAQSQQDILSGWERLEPLDIPEIWKLTCMIRGVALFRHANPAKAHEARERNLAVRRLLLELQAAE